MGADFTLGCVAAVARRDPGAPGSLGLVFPGYPASLSLPAQGAAGGRGAPLSPEPEYLCGQRRNLFELEIDRLRQDNDLPQFAADRCVVYVSTHLLLSGSSSALPITWRSVSVLVVLQTSLKSMRGGRLIVQYNQTSRHKSINAAVAGFMRCWITYTPDMCSRAEGAQALLYGHA